MPTKSSLLVISYGFAYVAIAYYFSHNSEGSELIFQKIIFSIAVSAFLFNCAELLELSLNSFKKSRIYIELAINDKGSENLAKLLFIDIPNKKINEKVTSAIIFILYGGSFFFSLFLLVYDNVPEEKAITLITIVSFGLSIIKVGLKDQYSLQQEQIMHAVEKKKIIQMTHESLEINKMLLADLKKKEDDAV